jgi:hypothetical protein
MGFRFISHANAMIKFISHADAMKGAMTGFLSKKSMLKFLIKKLKWYKILRIFIAKNILLKMVNFKIEMALEF